MFARYQQDARKLIEQITELVYFMRGSIQYESLMEKSFVERQIIGDFIKKRLEMETKRPNPVY